METFVIGALIVVAIFYGVNRLGKKKVEEAAARYIIARDAIGRQRRPLGRAELENDYALGYINGMFAGAREVSYFPSERDADEFMARALLGLIGVRGLVREMMATIDEASDRNSEDFMLGTLRGLQDYRGLGRGVVATGLAEQPGDLAAGTPGVSLAPDGSPST